jgi:hypothetical protein
MSYRRYLGTYMTIDSGTLCSEKILLETRVARYFLVEQTKMGKNTLLKHAKWS